MSQICEEHSSSLHPIAQLSKVLFLIHLDMYLLGQLKNLEHTYCGALRRYFRCLAVEVD